MDERVDEGVREVMLCEVALSIEAVLELCRVWDRLRVDREAE